MSRILPSVLLGLSTLIGAFGAHSSPLVPDDPRVRNAANAIIVDANAPAACLVLGTTCTLSTDCCSQTCSGNVCVNASGPMGCHADNDSCATGTDCCTGQCSNGSCVSLASLGAGTCMIDGEPCASSDVCCSKNCAAAPGGGNACQASSGCHVLGNLCTSDPACCGAAGSGGFGAGNVVCGAVAGSNPFVGTCTNASGCDPQGDTCGVVAGTRHDCCGCLPPAINCCRPARSGDLRCYGGSSASCPNGYDANTPGCCVTTGNICTFSDECCGGAPCLPDVAGVRHCATGPSAGGGACTTSSDCAAGLQCFGAPGAVSGTCRIPVDGVFGNGFE